MPTYHVAPTGNDSAAGTEAAPFRTISRGIARAAVGDDVLAQPGTYAEALTISKRITVKSEEKHGAKLRPPKGTWNAITIGTSGVIVDGFDIANVGGDGIEANGRSRPTIINCKVSGCGESGIQLNGCDLFRIEGNETFGNALTGWFSGISVYQNRVIEVNAAPIEGEFFNVIRGNVCRDNVTPSSGWSHTDGNGIIVDDFQSTQTSGFPNYTRPTLVEGNLCTGNGGKGIQVTWSDNVTVRGNTCAGNGTDPLDEGTWRGEISISQSKGAKVIDNIAVAKRGSGRLGNNRAYLNTSTTNRFNSTAYQGNIGWDQAGTPSERLDGSNPGGGAGIAWLDPMLGQDYLPRAAAARGKGWGAGAEPTPEPEEPEEPVEPTPVDPHEAEIADLKAQIAASQAREGEANVRVQAFRAWLEKAPS